MFPDDPTNPSGPTNPTNPSGLSDPAPDVLVEPPRQRRSPHRGLLTAAVVAAAVGAAALAGSTLASADDVGSSGVTSSSRASAGSDTESEAGDRDRGRFGRHGPGHLLGAMGGMPLHGEFVVPNRERNGSGSTGTTTYRTMVAQRGTASAISATSITVKSEDGFTQTYAVNADTRVRAGSGGVTSIKDGADVVVLGEKSGSTVTTLHVADLADLGRWADREGRRGMGGMGMGHMRGGMDGSAQGTFFGA